MKHGLLWDDRRQDACCLIQQRLICRVVLTPHVAGVTELSYRKMAQVVAKEARRMRDGLAPSIVLNSIAA